MSRETSPAPLSPNRKRKQKRSSSSPLAAFGDLDEFRRSECGKRNKGLRSGTSDERRKSASGGGGGIVCTDSDLSSMLTERRESTGQNTRPTSSRALALIQQGYKINGILSPDLTAVSYTEDIIFEQRNSRKLSAGSATVRHLEKNRIVEWDEEKEFVVDPSLIGGVIEEYLKMRKDKRGVTTRASFSCYGEKQRRTASTASAASACTRKASLHSAVNSSRSSNSVGIGPHIVLSDASPSSSSHSSNASDAGLLQPPPSPITAGNVNHKRLVLVDEKERARNRPRKLSFLTDGYSTTRRKSEALRQRLSEMIL